MRMPVLDGLAALREITADPAPGRGQGRHADHVRARRVRLRGAAGGASGFVLKDADPAELLRAVRVVADGGSLLSPRVTRRVIVAVRRPAAPARRRTRGWTS